MASVVPSNWSVHCTHHIAEDFESDIRKVLSGAIISTHLEPIDDHTSKEDINEN